MKKNMVLFAALLLVLFAVASWLLAESNPQSVTRTPVVVPATLPHG